MIRLFCKARVLTGLLICVNLSAWANQQVERISYQVETPLLKQAAMPAGEAKNKIVAYMPPATEFNYYLDIGKGIAAIANKNGYQSFIFAPQSDRPPEQIKMLEEAIRRNVSAIILSTHAPEQAAPLIEQAVAKGITVIVVNSDLTDFVTPVHAIVGYNQKNGTEKIGQYLVSRLAGRQAKVGIIEGSPGYHNSQRVAGFLQGINSSDLEVVASENGSWNTQGGREAALTMLNQYTDISVIFATNDFEIIGAYSAAMSLNLDSLILLGNDGDPAVLQRIAQGEIDATVNTSPVQMGNIAMQVVADIHNNRFGGGFVETPTVVVDKSNVAQFWQMPEDAAAQSSDLKVVSEVLPGLVEENGEGLYMDLLREVFDNYELEVIIAPYARAEQLVQSNQADILLPAYRGQPNKLIYPQWYFGVWSISALYQNQAIGDWQGQQSLLNHSVIWIRKYNFEQYLYTRVNKLTSVSRQSMLGMLAKGRVNAVLDDTFNLKKEWQVFKRINPELVSGNYQMQELLRLRQYLAFSDTDKGERLVNIFDDAFPKLITSGRLKALHKKWNIQPFPFDSLWSSEAYVADAGGQ